MFYFKKEENVTQMIFEILDTSERSALARFFSIKVNKFLFIEKPITLPDCSTKWYDECAAF